MLFKSSIFYKKLFDMSSILANYAGFWHENLWCQFLCQTATCFCANLLFAFWGFLSLIKSPARSGTARYISHFACNFLDDNSGFGFIFCCLHFCTSFLVLVQLIPTPLPVITCIILMHHIYL